MRSGKSLSGGYARLRRCLRVLGSPALAIRGYWRGTITALNLLAPVQSCFSKLLARQYTHPKSLPPSSVPHRARYFSQTLIHVRGRLRPTIEEVSAAASI